MGQTIACAAHNCPILVDDATVMKLVTDPKVKLKYQHLITNSFVQVLWEGKLLIWIMDKNFSYIYIDFIGMSGTLTFCILCLFISVIV